jgi:MFS family permease
VRSLSAWQLVALSSFGFATSLFTNTLDPALYGHKILQLAPQNPNTLLGITTAAGSALVIIMGPMVGQLSDQTRSRLGRRLPWFLAGVPVMLAALLAIGLAPAAWVFVAGVLIYRFGDNLIFSPWLALFADHVPAKQRGLAAGIKSLLDVLATLVGRLVAGQLLGSIALLGSLALYATMAMPATGLILALLSSWLLVRNLPRGKVRPARKNFWAAYRDSFRFNWKKELRFASWLANRFLFWTGFVLLSTFLLLFVIDVVGLPQADAQRFLARLSVVLGGAILAVAVPSGRLADRIGRRPLIAGSCAAAGIGTVMVLIFRDLNMLMVAAGIIGISAGIYISANFAHLTDLVPAAEAGRYLGLANVAGAAGGMLARLLGGLVIDPLNRATGDGRVGYLSVYALAALLFFAAAWVAARSPESKLRKAPKSAKLHS